MTGNETGNQTGDGDLYDESVHGLDDADLAPGAPDDPVVDDATGVDDDVRASEVDDITSAVPRPGGDGSDESIADIEEELTVEAALAEIDVEALLVERNDFKDIAQRVQAEYDNFRRQAQVRSQADIERETGRLAEALLPVLDAAEAAYLNHPAEVGPLLNQMLGELKKQGLEAMDLDGQPFDPELAEAVAHEPGAGGEPVVAEVLRSGYSWKGKTLRAAMVRTKD
ncbi:MAG: nucleotide exchange factor GrpE [Actinomycetota bacterium]